MILIFDNNYNHLINVFKTSLACLVFSRNSIIFYYVVCHMSCLTTASFGSESCEAGVMYF